MSEQPESQPEQPPVAPQPVKSPQRLRQEEWFLTFWRVMLLGATAWAGAYAWITLTWPRERLNQLAVETPHGALQLAVCLFLGIELAYYLYISATFRQCREWGMIVWALGIVAVVLNWNWRI